MQVNSILLSSDGHTDPEPLAINAASAAVYTSDIPWMGMPSATADMCIKILMCTVGIYLPSQNACAEEGPHACMFAGPIGAVRVAKLRDDSWVVNPSIKEQKAALLTLLYAGTPSACTLLEIQVWRVPWTQAHTHLHVMSHRIWPVVYRFRENPMRSAGPWCLPPLQMQLWLPTSESAQC